MLRDLLFSAGASISFFSLLLSLFSELNKRSQRKEKDAQSGAEKEKPGKRTIC
jgi:hypothetical protein